ncbi:MAG: hypothetical protein HWD61_08960 [Parachlamydiaceae bacterium]|nr:MAG: hypothetical protein HWD61_08960 [Parachlamydiaceae bacterium]
MLQYKLVDGKYEGDYKEWYSTGQLMRHYIYHQGQLNGSQEEFHFNGNPKLKVEYVEGQKRTLPRMVR